MASSSILEYCRARDVDTAESAQVGRGGLGVEQLVAALAEPFDQVNQSDFAGVGFPVEHAFAEECAAKADTIEPADQFVPCQASTLCAKPR